MCGGRHSDKAGSRIRTFALSKSLFRGMEKLCFASIHDNAPSTKHGQGVAQGLHGQGYGGSGALGE